MILFLAVFGLVFAQSTPTSTGQTTAFNPSQVATALVQLHARQDELTRQLVAAKKVNPSDPRIVTLETAIAELKTKITELEAVLAEKASTEDVQTISDYLADDLGPWLTELDDRVTALEEQPVHTPADDTVTYVSGGSFAAYAGLSTFIAEPLPGFTGPVDLGGHVGLRFSWALPGDGNKMVVLGEGEIAGGGAGVKGLLGPMKYGDSAGFGLVIGPGYSCSGLFNGLAGCSAERTGLVVEGVIDVGQGGFGLMIRPGVEINSASVPGTFGLEVRGTFDLSFRFGTGSSSVTLTSPT